MLFSHRENCNQGLLLEIYENLSTEAETHYNSVGSTSILQAQNESPLH